MIAYNPSDPSEKERSQPSFWRAEQVFLLIEPGLRQFKPGLYITANGHKKALGVVRMIARAIDPIEFEEGI